MRLWWTPQIYLGGGLGAGGMTGGARGGPGPGEDRWEVGEAGRAGDGAEQGSRGPRDVNLRLINRDAQKRAGVCISRKWADSEFESERT